MKYSVTTNLLTQKVVTCHKYDNKSREYSSCGNKSMKHSPHNNFFTVAPHFLLLKTSPVHITYQSYHQIAYASLSALENNEKTNK